MEYCVKFCYLVDAKTYSKEWLMCRKRFLAPLHCISPLRIVSFPKSLGLGLWACDRATVQCTFYSLCTDMSKSPRIGCMIPLNKLKCGITQPILDFFDMSVSINHIVITAPLRWYDMCMKWKIVRPLNWHSYSGKPSDSTKVGNLVTGNLVITGKAVLPRYR